MSSKDAKRYWHVTSRGRGDRRNKCCVALDTEHFSGAGVATKKGSGVTAQVLLPLD